MHRGFACKIAGEVKGFNVEEYMSSKDARTMDSFIHYGIAAAEQAVQRRWLAHRRSACRMSWPPASAA